MGYKGNLQPVFSIMWPSRAWVTKSTTLGHCRTYAVIACYLFRFRHGPRQDLREDPGVHSERWGSLTFLNSAWDPKVPRFQFSAFKALVSAMSEWGETVLKLRFVFWKFISCFHHQIIRTIYKNLCVCVCLCAHAHKYFVFFFLILRGSSFLTQCPLLLS